MGRKKEKSSEEKPASFEDACREIEELLRSNEYAKAYSKLRKLSDAYEDRPEFCCLWGQYYDMQKHYAEAAGWYQRATELDEKNFEYYGALANAHDNAKNKEGVTEALWRGARYCEKPLVFYTALERHYLSMGDMTGASQVALEVRTRFKDKGELAYMQGEAACVIKLYTTGIDFLRQSIDLHYEGVGLYYFLAEAFAYCDYNDHAVHFYKKALTSDPDNAAAYENLYNLLLWKLKSGNEKLLAALGWKRAKLTGDLTYQLQPQYLDLEESSHQEVLDAWLGDIDKNPARDYEIFCELYRNLLLYKKDHESPSFDPAVSLKKCIGKLAEMGAATMATYYEAWCECLKDDPKKAEALFTLLREDEELPEKVREGIQHGLSLARDKQDAEHAPPELPPPPARSDGRPEVPSYPDAIPCGTDLSASIEKDSYTPAKGLDSVVEKMLEALAYGPKRNLLLSGPSGVGKTAAIRQLAHLINTDVCPAALRGYKIMQVSTSMILAGAIYVGQWQKRLEEVCRRGSLAKRKVLYFEDIANIFSAGSTLQDTARFADFLVPRMEQDEIAVIGEVDSHQVQSLFWNEPRFERLVTEIQVKEPPRDIVLDILRDVGLREGAKRRVTLSDEGLREAVDVTDVFMPYKAQPGKAVDLVKNSIAMWGAGERREDVKISSGEIVLTFSDMTGVPDFILDRNEPLEPEKMKTFFAERILDQDEAVSSLTNAVTAFKARLCDVQKPIRSFMFVGPTGVGKTESAKVLAEFLFGSPERIVRLDMSEFNDHGAVMKLIGSHIGTGPRAGRLLEDIRRSPFSVVLLDEIEKAHPDVLNLLLQLLDEGILSDAEGKPAYFRSAIIVMTSNIGARFYTTRAIGFGSDADLRNAQQAVLSEVRKFFPPEIFNRLDEVICFRPLSLEVLRTIINREIGKVLKRRGVIDSGISVEVDPLAMERIIETGYDPKYGARHIRRAVEAVVALPLARLMASKRLPFGSQVRINIRNNQPVADEVQIEGVMVSGRREREGAPSIRPAHAVSDKRLGQALASMETRIAALKAKLGYDGLLEEKEELEAQMVAARFWDEPGRANVVLRRYAELGRRLERIHKWEALFERIRSTINAPVAKQSRQDVARAKAHLAGLLKDLESAEMEVLLEGKYDSADAFMIINSTAKEREDIAWMLELAGVYTSWAKRRGYAHRLFGERVDGPAGECSVFLHIGGVNAFGLLKNERGVHRKTIVKKVDSEQKISKQNHDCEVIVLADVQPLDDSSKQFEVDIRKIHPPVRGMKVKSLTRRVLLSDRRTKHTLDFLSDTVVEQDKNLPGELFMSYMHYQEGKKRGAREKDLGVWGSLVRTYEVSSKPRVVDHASKIILHNIKDYLGGNIDSLLLERLL